MKAYGSEQSLFDIKIAQRTLTASLNNAKTNYCTRQLLRAKVYPVLDQSDGWDFPISSFGYDILLCDSTSLLEAQHGSPYLCIAT